MNDLKDLKLNRAERRKMERDISKETGKSKDDITVTDVIASISSKRKKNNRRKSK